LIEVFVSILFALGLLGFFWPYLFYPLIISLLSRFVKNSVHSDPDFKPNITVLIPCFNEGRVIASKLKNTLELDYPKEQMQIIVVDSGSTDGTSQIVKEYDTVKLLIQEERCGKASGINFALSHATGDIVVVTDADAYLEKNALSVIGKHFSDPTVGVVGGKILAKQISNATKEGTSFLRAYEDFLGVRESHVDSTVNLGGELLAIRKELAKVDEWSLAEDFDCILNARSKGYRVILDPSALAWEYAPAKKSEIIVQKKRVMIGGIQCLSNYKRLILNPKYGYFGFLILPSHKVLQLVNNFMLMLVFFSSIAFYVLTGSGLMFAFLILESLFLFLCVFSYFSKIDSSPIVQLRYFALMQYALSLAWINFVLKRYNVKWERVDSKRQAEFSQISMLN
jgi:poly-beta-1,6-N-acetyl-D-glucosamine synthase